VVVPVRRRQPTALAELADLLQARSDTPGLLSAAGVRALALGIEQKHRCPVITDKLIAEAIRSAAIGLEYKTRGQELERRLRLLNDLLLSIDKDASPLCSIAVVDRLGAYLQSQPILAGALFLALLAAVAWPLIVGAAWSWWMLGLAAAVTAFAFLLCLSTERAVGCWKEPREGAGAGPAATVLRPARPRLLSDFFLLAASSRAKWAATFWHLVWGPAWETVAFVRHGARQLDAMHEFRFDVARGLWRDLKRADIDLEEGSDPDPVARAVLEQRFRELARKLWIVTGEPRFRTMEARGRIVREDRASGKVGLL
jgi:hypothetical protein